MPTSTHARLILHGKSADREDLRTAVARLRKRGHDVSVRVTWEPGDTQRFAREALSDAGSEEIDTIIAGGGDGTLNEVVAAILAEEHGERELPFSFGLLPLGTANDFAHGIGLNPQEIGECLWLAATAAPKATDLGRVNDRVFVNVATGGFGTRVTTETDPTLKKFLGGAAYLFTGLHRFGELTSSAARIRSPELNWEGEFLALAVGNGRQAGGGVQLCPDASLDDGLLDVTVIPTPHRDEMPDLMSCLMEKGLDGMRERAVTARVSELVIEADERLQVNLDGEPVHETRLEFTSLPQRIQFRRP